MTLFTLLIIIALERVVTKSRSWHIATIAQRYFVRMLSLFKQDSQDTKADGENKSEIGLMILIAALPTIAIWLLLAILPGFFIFLLYLVTLWICLGSPVTRKTYKRYLQAANRNDLAACALYSESFGNQDGDLTTVGQQLVLINYRQYAAVIIFFVLLGLPGMVFYSVCKEWLFFRKRAVCANKADVNEQIKEENTDQSTKNCHNVTTLDDENNEVVCELKAENSKIEAAMSVMLALDWIPVRITAFGFLLVGHFSSGLSAWLETLGTARMSAYELLNKVAQASEEINKNEKHYLQAPLQMVKLVKRNMIFLLVAISVMTLAGLIT